MIPDIFDPSKPHRCPTWGKPETCRCPSCINARKVMDSRQRLDAATKRNFAPTGRSFPSQRVTSELERPKETPIEKIERQREERFRELEKTWAYVQENEARYAAHRESVLAKRQKTEVPKFDLDEVLVNPELDALKSVKLDPASMLADDIESLTKEGKEFIKNPTLASAASMAVIAIPGKFLDDVGGHLAKEAFERNPFKTINGRKIINSDLAGQAVKTKGGEVFFDYDGFPDFTPYAEKIVRVPNLTGNRNKDTKLALDVLGMSDYNKKDMVWHHHQDGKTMLLVPKSVHSVPDGVAHTGGSAVIKHNKNNPDNQLLYPSPMEKK